MRLRVNYGKKWQSRVICILSLNWTESELQKLEVIQKKLCTVALGANMHACVEAIRGDMG